MTLIEKRMEEASRVWKDHENWRGYLATKQLTTNIPKWNDLYEGRHWNKVGKSTEKMPRPTMPFTKMIVNNKVSNIASGNVELRFIPEGNDPESKQRADEFTRFAKYQSKRMGMEAIDYDFILNDRKDGIAIKHYYWSDEERGRKGHYEGDLKCQIIDPLSFEVADPTEKDIQKQKWIQLVLREEVSKVKEMCDDESLKEFIVADDLETEYSDKTEMNDSDLCTIIVRYFKQDGEVFFKKSTKTIQICENTPLNPIIKRKMDKKKVKKTTNDGVEYEDIEDGKVASTPDEKVEKDNWNREDYYMATYYPIEICSLDPSKNSIFGLSEIQDLAVTQNIINICVAMGALNLIQLGAPKIVANKQALGDQRLNNEPAQVIFNQSNLPIDQIFKVVPAQPFTAQALEFAPALIELTRILTNSTEVITGEMLGKNLSGIAIRLLQEQSMKPIEMQRKRFWQHKEREGKILEMFYKLYFENKKYTYEYSSSERLDILQNEGRLVTDGAGVFSGGDYQDYSFSVVVEANQGSQFNESMQMEIVSQLLQMGQIDTDTYMELLPESMKAMRDKYKEVTFLRKQEELVQAMMQLQEQAQTIEGLNEEAKEREEVIKRKDALLNAMMKQIKTYAMANKQKPLAQQT